MPVITGKNRAEWMEAEMARRSGKPVPKPSNMYEEMSQNELKQHQDLLNKAMSKEKSEKE
ncbi:hypothetical protein UFOVP1019_58 [uncultured Caudovirales phage]|uniref:Uncharacterized protein n=1 Tax=uncultured Caudovirales phage TaxID=2100421 RepID=A0A6J5P395_9CAUD|nr:hypothetical protein UFOVP846_28 [uncultured Caudovirales phage]CAB4173396.1 hypothetical protein UFOVP940_60 [uncultured Caudovirales phage]CAB4178660.1 hypothetical protein UFOVP1019_58 [uncultured Caudovirales phage]CAB4219485.1 hypothetical protein UFOVP1618_32 [uncultured Caudovirales phage]